MLNLLSPQKVATAAGLVRSGRVYDLSVPLGKGGRLFPMFHDTWRITTAVPKADGAMVSGDVLMLHTHAGTHIDGLSHFWKDNQLWNGHDAAAVNSRVGASWAGIDKMDGIVSRGVLADIAGFRGVDHLTLDDAISESEIEACLEAQGVSVGEGDVLLVRTGWHGVFETDRATWQKGEPGVAPSVAAWLSENGVVAIGADSVAVEHIPQHPYPNPFHVSALRDYGVYIIENVDLEALAADRAYEFMFVAAPLPIVGGTGSPIKPLAIV